MRNLQLCKKKNERKGTRLNGIFHTWTKFSAICDGWKAALYFQKEHHVSYTPKSQCRRITCSRPYDFHEPVIHCAAAAAATAGQIHSQFSTFSFCTLFSNIIHRRKKFLPRNWAPSNVDFDDMSNQSRSVRMQTDVVFKLIYSVGGTYFSKVLSHAISWVYPNIDINFSHSIAYENVRLSQIYVV